MPRNVSGGAPRKSPLRIASGGQIPPQSGTALALATPPDSGPALRKMKISEFCDWLRFRTNKRKLPFAEETITAYKVAARALDAWMTEKEIEEDFTACDTATLNRFFADYLSAHGQTGTNAKQRHLRHLFTWLEAAYGRPHPYTDQLNRYAPLKTRPSTLSLQFIADLLEVTGNGQARTFADVRDHALHPVPVRGSAPHRSHRAPDDRPAAGSHRPALRAGGADQGRAFPGGRAPRAAVNGHGGGDRRLPEAAQEAQVRRAAPAVARPAQPPSGGRVGPVPDAPAASHTGGLRPGGPPAPVQAHARQRLEVVKQVSTNYQIGYISNMIPMRQQWLDEFFILSNTIVLSCEVGFRKPDLRIFNLAVKRRGCARALPSYRRQLTPYTRRKGRRNRWLAISRGALAQSPTGHR